MVADRSERLALCRRTGLRPTEARAAPAAGRSGPDRCRRSIAASTGRRCGATRRCRRRTRGERADGRPAETRRRRPPRTENSPGSSVGSWRVYPASTRRSPEIHRRDVVAGPDRQPAFLRRGGGRQSRQQRRRRGHHEARGAGARARRAPARAPRRRRSAAPGRDRDRPRGTGTAAPLRDASTSETPFERRVEEARVGGELFDLGVGRRNQHDGLTAAAAARKQRLRRRGQPADALAAAHQARAGRQPS